MIDYELSFEDRLNLNVDAGNLIHSFGDGYYIVDDYGREVNAFNEEDRFNKVIEKFRYRHFLIKMLEEAHNAKFDFGEDNILLIDGKPKIGSYWNLPKNENEVILFFNYISKKYKMS